MSFDFDVNGVHYQCTPMACRRQMHVLRRMGPAFVTTLQEVFNSFGSVQATMANLAALVDGDMANDDLLKKVLDTLPTMAEAMANMTDTDVDYIVDACLFTLTRQMEGGTGWAKVMAPGGQLMFQNTTLREMLEMTYRVLEYTYKDFFSAGPSSSKEQA